MISEIVAPRIHHHQAVERDDFFGVDAQQIYFQFSDLGVLEQQTAMTRPLRQSRPAFWESKVHSHP